MTENNLASTPADLQAQDEQNLGPHLPLNLDLLWDFELQI